RAGPGGHCPAHQGHREHAVGDHAGEAHRGREALAPVDRVEVAGGAGVADQIGPGDPEGLRLEGHGHSSPRCTSLAQTVTTGSPASVDTSLRVVMTSCPPRLVISSTVLTQTSASPATIGRRYANRWSPCTTRL